MKRVLGTFLLLMCLSGFAEGKRHRNSKPYFAALPPSRASMLLQNQMINQMGLVRIGDERELERMVERGDLIALPNNDAVQIAPSLPRNRRYVLPLTHYFIVKLATDYYAEFHQPLMVNSAVRPVTVQKWLRRHNASAAPIHGETASSHEAGCTMDISRHMTKDQTRWMEQRLLTYSYLGYVLVEEERKCFHVMVTINAALLETR